MVMAKANNESLIVFIKIECPEDSGDFWRESKFSELVSVSNDFFLCLPQHKEACLHWLNGGEVQYRIELYDWTDGSKNVSNSAWSIDNMFMLEQVELRIKPKKVKKYIGIYEGYKTTRVFDSEDDVDTFMMLIGVESYKVFEIEVEE